MLWQPRLIGPSQHWRRPQSASKVLTFIDSTVTTTDATTYTFSSHAIGTAASDRRVIVAASSCRSGTVTLSSCTVAGETADLIVQQADAGNDACVGLFIALVTTGTTGDIVVTFTGGQLRCGIGVWTLTGLSSSTANDSGGSVADPGSVTLDTLGGGVVVAAAAIIEVPPVCAWTNATEQYDELVEASNVMHSGAHNTSTSAGTLEIQCDFDSAETRRAMVAASW